MTLPSAGFAKWLQNSHVWSRDQLRRAFSINARNIDHLADFQSMM